MTTLGDKFSSKHWLGEMCHHPSLLHEVLCPFGDHAHVGTANEILDALEECRAADNAGIHES